MQRQPCQDWPPAAHGGDGESQTRLALAVLIVVIIAVIVWIVVSGPRGRGEGMSSGEPAPREAPVSLPWRYDADDHGPTDGGSGGHKEGMDVTPDGIMEGPQKRSVAESLTRLYSSEDVDPLVQAYACGSQEVVEGPLIVEASGEVHPDVTGRLYTDPANARYVYTGRTALGKQGLSEFGTGNSGEVGVDVGPYGLYEYAGKTMGYDDGVPAEWTLPESPIRWYTAQGYDNYGPTGPEPFKDGLSAPYVPDHLKLLGEDMEGTPYEAPDA